MDKNVIEIKLLCPETICGKCKRIIRTINEIIDELNIDASLKIITILEEQLKFKTWILPSLYIGDISCCKGYIPPKKFLIEDIKNILKKL